MHLFAPPASIVWRRPVLVCRIRFDGHYHVTRGQIRLAVRPVRFDDATEEGPAFGGVENHGPGRHKVILVFNFPLHAGRRVGVSLVAAKDQDKKKRSYERESPIDHVDSSFFSRRSRGGKVKVASQKATFFQRVFDP